VADLRAPTPSAAAELLTRDWSEWRQTVAKLQARLDRTARQALGDHRRNLARLASSYALREPRRVVRQWAQKLDDLTENLYAAAHNSIQDRLQDLRLLQARLAARHPAREIERRRDKLGHLAARLRTLGPQGTLDRGYALVLDAQGHPILQAKKELEGTSVRVVLSKGVVGANLTEAQPGKSLIDALHPHGAEAAVVVRKKSPSRKKKAT
jgi:exodeoxyribonuclease VII large subunit